MMIPVTLTEKKGSLIIEELHHYQQHIGKIARQQDGDFSKSFVTQMLIICYRWLKPCKTVINFKIQIS